MGIICSESFRRVRSCPRPKRLGAESGAIAGPGCGRLSANPVIPAPQARTSEWLSEPGMHSFGRQHGQLGVGVAACVEHDVKFYGGILSAKNHRINPMKRNRRWHKPGRRNE